MLFKNIYKAYLLLLLANGIKKAFIMKTYIYFYAPLSSFLTNAHVSSFRAFYITLLFHFCCCFYCNIVMFYDYNVLIYKTFFF